MSRHASSSDGPTFELWMLLVLLGACVVWPTVGLLVFCCALAYGAAWLIDKVW